MGFSKQSIKRAEALWQEYGASLSRMMYSYEADADLRQDLAQNVFLALLESVERIDNADKPKSYIFRIAHNVATDHVARESRLQWEALDYEIENESLSPHQQTENEQNRNRLMLAVTRLNLPLRQVTTLLLEGFGQEEIGDILKISHGNVRVRINRAKLALQEELKDERS